MKAKITQGSGISICSKCRKSVEKISLDYSHEQWTRPVSWPDPEAGGGSCRHVPAAVGCKCNTVDRVWIWRDFLRSRLFAPDASCRLVQASFSPIWKLPKDFRTLNCLTSNSLIQIPSDYKHLAKRPVALALETVSFGSSNPDPLYCVLRYQLTLLTLVILRDFP